MNELTNVTTGEVRLSYVHLFKPYGSMAGSRGKIQLHDPRAEDRYRYDGPHPGSHRRGKRKGTADKWGGVCPRSSRLRYMTETGYGLPMGWLSARSAKGTGYSRPTPRRTIPGDRG